MIAATIVRERKESRRNRIQATEIHEIAQIVPVRIESVRIERDLRENVRIERDLRESVLTESVRIESPANDRKDHQVIRNPIERVKKNLPDTIAAVAVAVAIAIAIAVAVAVTVAVAIAVTVAITAILLVHERRNGKPCGDIKHFEINTFCSRV